MNKLTDNEIIKALKICTSEDLGCQDGCPYISGGCVSEIKKHVLDLINRQKAEIEIKNTEIDILIRKKESLRDEIAELQAEIERLSK